MLSTRRVCLPTVARTGLADHQTIVDAIATFEDRVVQGKRRYRNRNRPHDPVFAVVRRVLQRMAPGENRCVYCEDSSAYQIDHFRPQHLYPEWIFVWENYVWSCGLCNHDKGTNFGIIRRGTAQIEQVQRNPNASPVPPPPGRPAVINPRAEDPLELLQLDLTDTFHFRPRTAAGTLEHERAILTIQTFGLNERGDLVAQRRNAAGNYEARLERYIRRRDDGATNRQLALDRNSLLRLDHPTVWREMQRQHDRVARIRPLFAAAPEALSW